MHDMRKTMSGKKSGRYLLAVGMVFLLLTGCASMTDKESTEGVSQETPAAVSSQQKQITGVIISGADSAETANRVLLTASGELEYTSIKQRDPLGIIFYFPDTSLGQIKSQYTPDSDTIASIKTSMSPDQKGARVEVSLKKDSSYEVKRTGNDLEILFLKAKSPVQEGQIAGAPAPLAAKTDNTTAATKKNMKGSEYSSNPPTKESKPQNAPKAASSKGTSAVDRIDFSSELSGKSSVIIGTTAPVEYELTKISDKTLKLRVFNSRLPEFRQHRPLITTRFASAIDRITPVQVADINATDIVIELREIVPYRPVQEGSIITLSFDASSIGPRQMDAAQLPEWQQALSKTETPAAQQISMPSESKPVVQSVLEPAEGKSEKIQEQTASELLLDKKVYTGQKIALDFYETDIKNVFRILQQVSGKNYAVDKDVNGEVTISLEKPVPWDQVMDLILQMNDLGKKEQGDIIRIAKNSKLKSEEQDMAAKMAAIRAKDDEKKLLEPIEIEFIPVNYASAKSEVKDKVKNMITKGRGSIDVDERNNQLIIQDTRKVIEKVKRVISEIDKVTPQVLIEARIVEVQTNYTRELGIGWGIGGADIYNDNLNGMYSYNVAVNQPAQLPANSQMAFNFTRLDAWGTPIVLDAALRAMEEQGEGKIISSPKILTLDNKEATIKQGLQVPYTETNDQGTTTTKYADALLSLKVTPHMTPDKRISMIVKTTKDDITGYSPDNQPILSINEAQTVLLVEDGATVVIGGVAKISTNEGESGFPILKDIPLLGYLFKTSRDTSQNQELLIFMTPKIVQLEQKNLVKIE